MPLSGAATDELAAPIESQDGSGFGSSGPIQPTLLSFILQLPLEQLTAHGSVELDPDQVAQPPTIRTTQPNLNIPPGEADRTNTLLGETAYPSGPQANTSLQFVEASQAPQSMASNEAEVQPETWRPTLGELSQFSNDLLRKESSNEANLPNNAAVQVPSISESLLSTAEQSQLAAYDARSSINRPAFGQHNTSELGLANNLRLVEEYDGHQNVFLNRAVERFAELNTAMRPSLDDDQLVGTSDTAEMFHLMQLRFGEDAHAVERQMKPYASSATAAAVTVQLAQAIDGRSGRFEVQLTPEELGRVEIAMEFDGDRKAQLTIMVERSETLELLSREQRQLERILQSQGIELDGGLQLSMRQDQTNRQSSNGHPLPDNSSSDLGSQSGQDSQDTEPRGDARPLIAGNGLFDVVI